MLLHERMRVDAPRPLFFIAAMFVGAKLLAGILLAKRERDLERVVGTQFVRQHSRAEPIEPRVYIDGLAREDSRRGKAFRANKALTRLATVVFIAEGPKPGTEDDQVGIFAQPSPRYCSNRRSLDTNNVIGLALQSFPTSGVAAEYARERGILFNRYGASQPPHPRQP